MEDDSAVVSIAIFRIFIQQKARTISSVFLFTHLKVTILIPLLPLAPQSKLPQFPFQISLVSSYLDCLHMCLPTIGYGHRTWNATFMLNTTPGCFLLHLELNSNSLPSSFSLLHYAAVKLSLFWSVRHTKFISALEILPWNVLHLTFR